MHSYPIKPRIPFTTVSPNKQMPPKAKGTHQKRPPKNRTEIARAATAIQMPQPAIVFHQARKDLSTFCVISLFGPDRKSTRLNSSHVKISYAVFCLKKKNRTIRKV